eukprot:727919-Amphidinium_carterae.1
MTIPANALTRESAAMLKEVCKKYGKMFCDSEQSDEALVSRTMSHRIATRLPISCFLLEHVQAQKSTIVLGARVDES